MCPLDVRLGHFPVRLGYLIIKFDMQFEELLFREGESNLRYLVMCVQPTIDMGKQYDFSDHCLVHILVMITRNWIKTSPGYFQGYAAYTE